MQDQKSIDNGITWNYLFLFLFYNAYTNVNIIQILEPKPPKLVVLLK